LNAHRNVAQPDGAGLKSNRRKISATPAVCPICGEDVPPRALACPACGADHKSGWREDAEVYDGADLREDEFDYDEFVRDEFGGGARPRGVSALWWITAIVLLIAFAALYFYAR
jgi:hypothetical protein